MAVTDIKVGIQVSSNGTIDKETKSAKNLKDMLDGTTASATRASKALSQAQSSGQGKITSQEVMDYNRARAAGTGAGTGAGARDFAAQAQGLGGLVRLYATFAANIFAVSAAFENLNRAAQYERLIKASEMMSVSVGMNLKGIGKSLQEVTNYAISFEDAMQFTNLGVSAGLAAKDIQNLVVIAKGAAAGLGRDVNDSIRRIIQGTAKQEQEILDELGIFVKAKQAYENYAKAFDIKGGADALSAQQKVAAYAQAVAQAGEKWKEFSTLDDPFSRFTAKGKEALTVILQAVNSVLGPILDIIAKSGDAIVAIILAASGLLLKRAIPELKGLITDLFTFDKARAAAQAGAARLEVVKEYVKTTQELQNLKKQRDAIIAPEPTKPSDIIAKVGAMAGVARGEVGIFPQKLATRLMGEGGENLANIKTAADVEKTIASTLKDQYKTRKDQDAVIKALVDKKIIEEGSTLKTITLTKEAKALSADIYNSLNLGNAELAKKLSLTEKIAIVEAKLVQLGQQKLQIDTLNAGTAGAEYTGRGRRRRGRTTEQKAAPLVPQISPTSASELTKLYKTMSTGEKVTQGWNQGLAQSAENIKTLNLTADKGYKESLKNFFGILSNSIDNVGKVGQGLGFMGRTAAVAGSALSTLGLVATGVFRAIAAAFGPIMIAWSIWELVGPKLLDSLGFNYTANKKLKESQEEVRESFDLSGDSLARLVQMQEKTEKTSLEYSRALGIASNNVDSLINSIDKLLEKQDLSIAQTERQKAIKEAAAAQRAFSTEAFQIQQLLKSGFYDPALKKDLQELAYLFEEDANSTESNAESKRKLYIRFRELNVENKKYFEQQKSAQGILENSKKAAESSIEEILRLTKNRTSAEAEFSTTQAQSINNYLKLLQKESQDVEQVGRNYKDLVTFLEKVKEVSPEAGRALLMITSAMSTSAALEAFRQGKFAQVISTETEQASKKYSVAAEKGFAAVETSIKSAEMTLIKLDTAFEDVTSINKRNQSVRGYATELENAAQAQFEIAKAQQEYEKTLLQIRLEEEKVTKAQKDVTSTEKQRATQVADSRREEAKLILEQRKAKTVSAQIDANIQSAVQKTTKEYDIQLDKLKTSADLKSNYLKYDDLGLKIAKETNSLTEKDTAMREKQVELRKIESNYQREIDQLRKEQEKELAIIKLRQASVEETTKAEQEVNDKYDRRRGLLSTIRLTDENILSISTQQKLVQAELVEKLKEINKLNERKEIAYSTETELLSIQKQVLQQQLDQGILTQDQYSGNVRLLEKMSSEMEYQEKLRKLLVEKEKALQQIYADEEKLEEFTPEMGRRMAEALEKYDLQFVVLNRVKAAQDSLRNSQEILTERQKGYGEVIKNSFNAMADAIVEFAKTGKLNFKDLVNSLLADILRLELRMQAMAMYQAARPGLMNLIGSSFGSKMDTSPVSSFTSDPFVLPGSFAKGGTFESGITKYAKGGMFTNSIVDSPTLFKFAKGTGLMGEAGPEAIVPLKRDSQGNLGVRANGGGVNVVVNNYSQERAEARETVDSRGNRRIEVVVGDMTAGEIVRGGSSTNRSIRNTFGLQPQLIRR